MRRPIVFAAALCCLAPALASGQMYVYPQKGQSAKQQQRDEGECHQWAVQQTGYNPGMASAPSSAPDGSLVRGGARGAAAGAVVGAIAGNAGKGAAAGAAGGALIGGMRRRDSRRQQEQANASGQQGYQRAYGACMQGRGYSVN
jgi:hypothetical protein